MGPSTIRGFSVEGSSNWNCTIHDMRPQRGWCRLGNRTLHEKRLHRGRCDSVLRANHRARVYQLQVSVGHVIVPGDIKLKPPSMIYKDNSLKINTFRCSVFCSNVIFDSVRYVSFIVRRTFHVEDSNRARYPVWDLPCCGPYRGRHL